MPIYVIRHKPRPPCHSTNKTRPSTGNQAEATPPPRSFRAQATPRPVLSSRSPRPLTAAECPRPATGSAPSPRCSLHPRARPGPAASPRSALPLPTPSGPAAAVLTRGAAEARGVSPQWGLLLGVRLLGDTRTAPGYTHHPKHRPAKAARRCTSSGNSPCPPCSLTCAAHRCPGAGAGQRPAGMAAVLRRGHRGTLLGRVSLQSPRLTPARRLRRAAASPTLTRRAKERAGATLLTQG